MKIFVTGGTGFIGSHFVNLALKAGHDVVAQRRPGSRARVPLVQEPVWIDRALDQDFTGQFDKCDVVVHFASHSMYPPYAALDECIYWNVFATMRLLQQASEQGVRKVLVAGSCFEYGSAAEGQDLVHPATEPRPMLTYSVSKAAATTACLGLARQLQLRMQVLRIFQVFGEGEASSRFWPSLKSAALNGSDFSMTAGVQIRDFIHVTEVAQEFLRALDFEDVEPSKPHVRNIGTGKGQSLLEFANFWWDEWQAPGSLLPGTIGLRPGELARLVANVRDTNIG